MTQVAVIGEPLAELVFAPDGALRLGLGGDAANVAVALARGGCDVALHTAFGADVLSDMVAARLHGGGVQVAGPRLAGQSVGIYLVGTDEEGERSFTYWRDGSAASRYLADGIEQIVEAIGSSDVIVFSGITLALLRRDGRSILRDGLASARAFVVFDPNYRPALWPDLAEAVSAARELLPVTDAVLASRDDCAALLGSPNAETGARSLASAGVPHVAVTDAAAGCVIVDDNEEMRIASPAAPRVLDTTGAGDAFDAGWIHGWVRGAGARERALAGLEAAAVCVAQLGALGDRPPVGRGSTWEAL